MNDYISVKAGKEFWDLLDLIFSDEFMQKHTNFENFEYFRYSSAVMVNWGEAFMVYPETVFNNFVIESTEFSSWDQMVMTAADEKFTTSKN